MTDKPTPLDIIHADEPVLEFRLSNGFTARARLALTGAWEMPGELDVFGCPPVQVNYQILVMGLIPTPKSN
jgi:hypothetical protein